MNNEALKEYLMRKYGEDLERAQGQQRDNQFGDDMLMASEKIGSAIAGVQPNIDQKYYDAQREQNAQPVKQVQQKRDTAMKDYSTSRQMVEDEREDTEYDHKQSLTKRDEDSTSEESRLAQSLASKMMPGRDFSQMTAAQINRSLPTIKGMYEVDQRRLDRKDANSIKIDAKNEKKKVLLNEVEDRRQNIHANLDILDGMIAENGTFETLGSHNQDLDRLVDQVATDMAKLMDPDSVARPNEVELVKKNLIRSGFNNQNSTARDIIKNFKGEVERRANTAYQIRGIENPNAKAPTSPTASGGQATAQSKTPPARVKQNGKTYEWDGKAYREVK